MFPEERGKRARERIKFLDELETSEKGEWDGMAWTNRPDAAQVSRAPKARTGPKPRRAIRSPEDAEQAAAAHLRWLGFKGVNCTPKGPDAGIDVRGIGIVAQVKAAMKPTGLPVIVQVFGAAQNVSASAAVFALNGFTRQAVKWADDAGVALFVFNLMGEAEAVNVAAQRLKP